MLFFERAFSTPNPFGMMMMLGIGGRGGRVFVGEAGR
jgi:hypothetical protein